MSQPAPPDSAAEEISEVTADPATGTATTEAPAKESDGRSFSFADMRLQPGDRIQVHCPTHAQRTRHIAKVVGFVEGVSLLVTLPARAEFLANEILVVQVFSRDSAYAFKATIQRINKLPFEYMHLSFPDRVQGSIVRKATRVRIKLDSQARPAAGGEAAATIIDLSATGARLRSETPLGEIGSAIHLSFDVNLHDVVSTISVGATLQGIEGEGEGQASFYGVAFNDLPPNERMILRSLIYQQMVENPKSLA